MRSLVLLAPALAVAGCGPAAPRASTAVEGTIAVPAGASGDAYVLLYAPGEGPPARPAAPELATAVSSVRLASDPHFVFAAVPDGGHRLWGFLDQDRSFRADVDVLAQPTAGDLAARGLELQDRTVPEPLALDVPTAFDPPAFEIAGAGSFVVLPDQPLLPVRFSIQTTRLSGLLPQVAFAVSLGDGNGTLFPQIAFRFLPRPGQPDAEVLIPCAIETGPTLQASLGGDPARLLPLDQLPLDVLPFAVDAAGAALPAIPVGEYQLVVVEASGQVWTLPNGLAPSEPTQAVRFFVQHAAFASGLP